MTKTQVTRHDVVVVGARCAGSSTARLLARRGHDVVVVERAELPSDTLSTHGIARGGVVQLARWGLLDRVLASGAPPVREVMFATDEGDTTRPIKARAGVDLLVAPRRSVLDSILADDAVAGGVTLRTGTTATGLLRDDRGRVAGITARTRDGERLALHARHVVAADGLRSATAARLGARERRSFAADITLFYLYVDSVPWRGFEFHIAPQGFAGVFPTHDGAACVWLTRPTALLDSVRTAGARRTQALVAALAEVAPGLAARVRSGRVVSPTRGTVSPPNYVRDASGPGWALVGDAGYHRDPITGHGITDAFRDAELLAEALHETLAGSTPERAALEGYGAARDAALRDTFRLTRELTRFPDPSRFVELQIELSEALDREAQTLASRPAPAGLSPATAA
ncbi:MAG TPA: NAD(P)/FAD-dependent oxidoreductase [Nocardioidaceae bacterium]|nr:NAD(P)/FAD-dependent oxidoreductase [Nocardioidaceae bacterium]